MKQSSINEYEMLTCATMLQCVKLRDYQDTVTFPGELLLSECRLQVIKVGVYYFGERKMGKTLLFLLLMELPAAAVCSVCSLGMLQIVSAFPS